MHVLHIHTRAQKRNALRLTKNMNLVFLADLNCFVSFACSALFVHWVAVEPGEKKLASSVMFLLLPTPVYFTEVVQWNILNASFLFVSMNILSRL